MQFDNSSRRALDPIETASIDELRDLQLIRMQWSIAHAYNNVPAYKKLCDEKGVHPYELKSLDDLKNFPFTTKAYLRDAYPFDSFAVPMN
ncbi:phenylacetate--CoA ligase, partial [Pontibacterium granulatum]|uniref:phenylacetate--CoA ligase family protein n=1 Tax=Pontibacterium granulatum TaxID=2036029 RepID=UPI003CE5BED1|nr:phenylacetate--CoA ligase [Pontibacterium granulatum]